MNSKEIQLSLSFCGALATLILISSPLNEKSALVGSILACIISGVFFYGGISKYFAEKEKQNQITEDQNKLLIEKFEAKLAKNQNSTNVQLQSALIKINDTLSNSLEKPVSELQNSTSAQLQEVIEVIEKLNDTLSYSVKKPVSELQNSTNAMLKEVVESIENLEDNLNDSMGATLNEVSDNLSNLFDSVKLIKIETENICSNTNKLKEFNKTSAEILENIEDLSKNVAEVSKLNETLQELLRTTKHQEEFYQTMLSQYKNMTSKDVELIENLARKLK